MASAASKSQSTISSPNSASSRKQLLTAPSNSARFCRLPRSTPSRLAPYLTWDRQQLHPQSDRQKLLSRLLAICWKSPGQLRSQPRDRIVDGRPIGRLLVENFRVIHQDIAAGKIYNPVL